MAEYLKEYQIIYQRDDGEDEIEPVTAYSKEQAQFLASCRVEQILDVEEVISKGRRYC